MLIFEVDFYLLNIKLVMDIYFIIFNLSLYKLIKYQFACCVDI